MEDESQETTNAVTKTILDRLLVDITTLKQDNRDLQNELKALTIVNAKLSERMTVWAGGLSALILLASGIAAYIGSRP